MSVSDMQDCPGDEPGSWKLRRGEEEVDVVVRGGPDGPTIGLGVHDGCETAFLTLNLNDAARLSAVLRMAGRRTPRRAPGARMSDPTRETPDPAETDEALKLGLVAAAVRDYHHGLDCREHGGILGARLVDRVREILGMPWVQGEEKERRRALAEMGEAMREGVAE